MASDSILSPSFSEDQWVNQISENFANEVALDISNVPVSVCNVPKATSNVKPEAYAPQVVALGPYHHLRPELYQMERFKLAAVKSFLKPDQIRDFQQIMIDKLKELDLTIRACYHKYLDFDDNTLAWIIGIDGLFLLYLLSKYTNTSDAVLHKDVMMLENQIPSILLKAIRKTLQLSSPNDEDDAALFSMMRDFCEAQSPFELASKSQKFQEKTSLHLLDLLYNLIVSHQESKTATAPQKVLSWQESVSLDIQPDALIQNIEEIVQIGSSLPIGGQVLMRPIQVIEKIPWGMVTNLLGLKSGDKISHSNPLVNEITIPSVSYLVTIGGIKVTPTTGGIRDIKFDDVEATLYLAVITLNANSEVILRNLVAYEVASVFGSTLELAQYIDLMSGIIDTADDAGLLRTGGIIKGDLTDEEIAVLFNGMNKSTGKGYNETTAKINAYFNKRPNVKVYRFTRERVYASWKALTVLSTIVLLLLLILQSFCQVYSCPRFFGRSS